MSVITSIKWSTKVVLNRFLVKMNYKGVFRLFPAARYGPYGLHMGSMVGDMVKAGTVRRMKIYMHRLLQDVHACHAQLLAEKYIKKDTRIVLEESFSFFRIIRSALFAMVM